MHYEKDRLPSSSGFISILKLITRHGSMKNARILQSILMLCSSFPNWVFWKHGQFLYVKWKAVIWEESGLELYVIKYILLIIRQFDSSKKLQIAIRALYICDRCCLLDHELRDLSQAETKMIVVEKNHHFPWK